MKRVIEPIRRAAASVFFGTPAAAVIPRAPVVITNLTRKNPTAKGLANAKNNNQTRRRRIAAEQFASNPVQFLSGYGQIASKARIDAISKKQQHVFPSVAMRDNQAPFLKILGATFTYIPLILFVARRAFTPEEFIALNEYLTDPSNQNALLSTQITFKNNAGGRWSKLIKDMCVIPDKTRRELNKDKPTNENIQTNIDHIVPRAEIAIKYVMTIVSSIRFNYDEVGRMTIEEFDQYVKNEVIKNLPTLDELQMIDEVYTGPGNLRVIKEVDNEIYKNITAHVNDKKTFLPLTWSANYDNLETGGPSQIIGYKGKKSDAGKHTKEAVLSYILKTNNSLTNDLILRGTPFVKKFAVNMQNYIRQRIGLPGLVAHGGALSTMDEYSLYNYLVYTFGTVYNESNAEDTTKEVSYIQIQENIKELSISVFKHLILQNKIIDGMMMIALKKK